MSVPTLREGFTTSACAAAAASAGVRALLTGQPVRRVVIDLPARPQVTFEIHRCELGEGWAMCSVIKDAGDDPDVTHGAEIQARVEWMREPQMARSADDAPAISIAGGPGVGIVTRPGLPVPVGEPAINPIPRRIITQAVVAALADTPASALPVQPALRVTISVPNGAALAEKTMNPRLGILGGISILGTTGIVKPFSQAAYRASIFAELKAAAANGLRQAALATGARSEDYAFQKLGRLGTDPDLPERMGYVQVGDHMGYAVRQCQR
uniref:cobalt-precorrin-5B (C(1))-methyltransferase CbiD n=1 Tax=Candidatus Roseilinea sp. TaxID=2838777 RepID=UPI00404A1CD6